MKTIQFILLSVFILCCGDSTTPTGPGIGEEFGLTVGQTVQIRDKHFSLKFHKVAEDSRCPTGAVCVWEGNAKIVLQIAHHDTSLNTSLEPKEINYTGEQNITYTVRLLSVSPYPNINEQRNTEEYSIKLIVFSNEMF